jgi:hypothetical protein
VQLVPHPWMNERTKEKEEEDSLLGLDQKWFDHLIRSTWEVFDRFISLPHTRKRRNKFK